MLKLCLACAALICCAGSFATQVGQNKRDYTNNHAATDKDWFYLNHDGSPKSAGGGDFPSLEFQSGRTPREGFPAVYTRGSNLTIGVTFKNIQFYARSVSLTLNGARLLQSHLSGSPTQTLSVSSSSSSFTIPAQGEETVTFTVSSTPNHVTRGILQLDYVLTENSNTILTTNGWASWETIYFTFSSPTGHQATPWTEVLDLGTTWAEGRSTGVTALEQMTVEMFDAKPFAYSSAGSQWIDANDDKFELKSFLEEVQTPVGDCVDISSLLHIISGSLGVSTTMPILTYDDPGNSILTNRIVTMGMNRSWGTYAFITWPAHCVNEYSSGVYDATVSLKYDLAGSTYKAPALGWNRDAFWQTQSLDPESTGVPDSQKAYLGLARSPSQSNAPQQVDYCPSSHSIGGVK